MIGDCRLRRRGRRSRSRNMNEKSITQHYLDDTRASFRAYKKLADKALAQVRDDEYFVALDQESNSIAVIMKHLAGNMLSRWTDFLVSDGEKPNRNRDMEFVIEPQPRKRRCLLIGNRGGPASLMRSSRCNLRTLIRKFQFGERPYNRSGDQSPNDALRLSHRPDCIYGEASPV